MNVFAGVHRRLVIRLSSVIVPVLVLGALVALLPQRLFAAFTFGNIVIYRVGSGTGSLVNTGNPIFLDEYTPSGVFVRSIAMPTTTVGAQRRMVASGTATSEGLLSRSGDGLYLILTGYDAALPTTGLTGTTSAAVPRVVGRVDAFDVVDTSTALTDFASGNNVRAATSADGSGFWVAGGTSGVRYATIGSTTSTSVSTTVTNLRQLSIFGGQLLASTGSGTAVRVGSVGSGLPTASGQTLTNLTGIPTTGSPYAFFLADLTPAVAGDDTLYVADDSTGLEKYSLVGGTWVANGVVGVNADDYRGVTGTVSGSTATLYATRSGGSGATLVLLVDSGGYNAAFSSSTPTVLATAASNTAFRGVALAPGLPPLTPTVTLSVSANAGSEAAGTAVTVTVTASAPVTGDQAVSVAVTGAGIDGGDYTLSSTTIPILNGATSGSVSFTVLDDVSVEGPETATLTISSPSAGILLGSPVSQDIAIADDDAPANALPTIDPIAPLSGVLSDSTNASTTVVVADTETPVANLTVSATATSNPSVVPLGNITITGTDAMRTVSITPAGVGYASITITVTDAGGQSASSLLAYAASAASSVPATTRHHTGASDGSTGVAVDTDHMLVADDENQTIRLYSRMLSGGPLKSFDFTGVLGLTDINGSGQIREVDIEASARIGDRIYWAGSQGNAADGDLRPNRYRLFASDLTLAGADSGLTFAGRYDYLRADLITWDSSNAHGLGADYYGLAASAASGISPEAANGSGFNLEGMTVAPDGSTVYLAFRAPLATPGTRTKALIVALLNIDALLSPTGGVVGSSLFGAPIELALGGRSIRSIERNDAAQYVVVAGPSGVATGVAPNDFRLFTWTGSAANAPVLRTASLTPLQADGAFEGIVEVPAVLDATTVLQLIVDTGDVVYYNDAVIAKELPEPNFRKFRTERVALGAVAPPETSTGSTPVPGDIVINEYASDNDLNGNDFFELLVINDGLDLRGLRVSDNEVQLDGSLNNNESVLVFGNDVYLSNVPAGTVIAVYTLAAGVVTDTVVNPAVIDWRMVLAPGTGVTGSIDGLGGSLNLGLSTGGDALYLYLPGPNGTSAGTDNVYLDYVSWEGGGGAPSGFAAIDLLSLADNAYYIGSTAAGNDVAANWVRYDGAPNASTTTGDANPTQDLSGLRPGSVLPGVVIVQGGGSTDVAEGGGTDSYTIALRTAPAGAVQIQATGSAEAELSLDGVSFFQTVIVTLTTTTPGIVYVRAIDDAVTDGTTLTTVTHSIVVSADPAYSDALTPVSSVSVTVADNDILTTAIHTIQGAGSASPFVGASVTTRGVVTARKSNGFYIQTPDTDVDVDSLTSEGIFVFTSSAPPVSAAVGNLVVVSGTVVEFVPSADAGSPPITELVAPSVTLQSTSNALPSAVSLTAASMQVGLEPFEAFEGMRVFIATLTVVSPTAGFITESSASSTSSGVFYGVLPGVARPFRETGLEIGDPAPPEATSPGTIPRFDANPERIRVETTTLGGSPIDVTTFATVSGLFGVFDFRFRASTLLVEPTAVPTVAGNISANAVRSRESDEFTVATFNMERFYDTVNDGSTSDVVLTPAAVERRLAKASLAIRNVMRTPDVVGVEEVENLSILQTLADRVNSDALAAGQLNVFYAAQLMEGNDIGGIDVGFLVNTAFVQIVDVTQIGKDTTYLPPGASTPAVLNDRPSLVLRAQMNVPGFPAYPVTVIVNHLRSLSGIDHPTDGDRVRTKRRLQAEFLAAYVQSRQAADPAERIILVGDFNAFQLNDGFVDVIGTILGDPTPADFVAQASADVVNPNLVNLVLNVAADQRYSFMFDGNAQSLDHILVTQNLIGSLDYARSNADFPEVYRNDATRPERVTDHDMLVGYFTLAPDSAPPVVTVPASFSVEGTGTSTIVTFVVTALDASDGAVAATCTPQSGSGFPLGTTAVTCTATDANNNTSPDSVFSVTVVDTTAPVLSLPAPITAEATGAAGKTVSFSTSALDVVDGAVTPVCDAASGAAFAIGTTTVSCTATDTRGNSSGATFTVTIVDTTAPVVTVPADGTVEATGPGGAAVSFGATAADIVSGATAVSCDPAAGSVFAFGETLVRCTSMDAAGNEGSALFRVTVVDTTVPAITIVAPAAVSYNVGQVVAANYACTDSGSGVASCVGTVAAGSAIDTSAPGPVTFSVTATDVKGLISTSTVTYSVVSPPGHMAGYGWLPVVGDPGSRLLFSFDVTGPSRTNGLMILRTTDRWGRLKSKGSFDATQISTVIFLDSPTWVPGWWARPIVDTVVMRGRGRWNNVAGYTFEARATDRGEPGAGNDTFAVTVLDASGRIVYSIDAVLGGGNVNSFRVRGR